MVHNLSSRKFNSKCFIPKNAYFNQSLHIIGIGTCFLICLFFPSATIKGAEYGVHLCLTKIIPIFFPFLILVYLIQTMKLYEFLGNLLGPILCMFLPITRTGAYCVFIGLLCGYPLGTISIKEQVLRQNITKKEASYLLSFCNQPSPMFLSGYLLAANFPNEAISGWKFVLLYFLTLIIVATLMRIIIIQSQPSKHSQQKTFIHIQPASNISMIQKVTNQLLSICFYIVLFTTIQSVLRHTLPMNPKIITCVCSFLEFSSGVSSLANTNLYDPFYLACLCTFSGGLSCMAQSYQIWKETNLSFMPYISGKCVQLIVFSILYFSLKTVL